MQVIAGARHGGAETFFLRLVEAFARAGVTQRAATRPHPGWHERLAAAGVESVALPFGGILDFTTGRALRREIAAFRPDIVLAWMGRAARFSPAGRHVAHDAHRLDGTGLREERFQLAFRGVVREIPDVQLLTHAD